MKSIRILAIATLALATFGLNPVHAANYSLSGAMDALQAGTNGGFGTFNDAVPGGGNGTGLIAGDYDDATNILNYQLTWQDLSGTVSNMHFHLGAPGVGGGVEVGIPGPWSSPQIGNNIVLSDAQESNLLAGNWYVNIHTSPNFGGGEIRGQVLVSPVPEPATAGLVGALALLFGMGLRPSRRAGQA